jgi:crotonobetainyl-CoA:carnitine CoA-transferase CaiB-like acyl-CoA transferase
MDTEMLDKDPYAIEREALIEVPDADMPGGWLPMHGMVPRLSATPGILARPAPKLGEHNSEILRAALGAARYESLCAAKVIRD